MDITEFAQASALIATDDLLFRRRLVNQLQAAGFSRVVDVADCDSFESALQEGDFDLLIAAAHLPGEAAPSQIGRVRDGRHRHHPFPFVIVLASERDKEILAKIVNCGPDDVVLMPVEPPHLLARIRAHARQRKAFIVTSDFVGPDRRKAARPGQAPPLLSVPNPLAARSAGTSADAFAAEVDAARLALTAIKVERTVLELRWLHQSITRLAADPAADPEKRTLYRRRADAIATALPTRLPVAAASPVVAAVSGLSSAARAPVPDDATLLERIAALIAVIPSLPLAPTANDARPP